MNYITGCDISRWQGNVDFNQAKTIASYFIIKCSGGEIGLYVDPLFVQNRDRARAAGVVRGFYHFAGGGNPVQEAEWFVKSLGSGGLQPGELLALDFEVPYGNPGAWSQAFVQQVYKMTGVWCLVYANRSQMAQIYTWVQSVCGLWLADPNDPPTQDATYNGQVVPYAYIMHQYKEDNLPGVAGKVDIDAFFGTLEQLKKYGLGEPTAPAPTPAPTPTPEPTPVPTPVPTPTPLPDPIEVQNNNLLKQILALLQSLTDKITGIFK